MSGSHGPTIRAPRAVARLLAPILFATAVVAVRALPARSVDVPDDMPNQTSLDAAAPDESQIGQWGDMAGGVAARPYVLALSVTNGGTTTQVIADGSTTPPATDPGDVTATIEPYNLCTDSQDPLVDECYATPNRIAVSVVYAKENVVGSNFAAPSETVTPLVDADSIIDLTLALNTLGESLRWTWINGDLLYWRTTNLGSPDATLRVRFRPAERPWFFNDGSQNGCSASPPTGCTVTQAEAETLSASLVLSLDDSLDPALTGAAFATQNALFGYLEPGGDPMSGPILTVKASSTHLRSDGSPQLGVVQAFIPSAAIVNLFGVLPADAAGVFTVTRSSGDGGTQGTPTYATWTAAANGADGLFITVPDVTFSVPAYDVTQDLWFSSGGQEASGRTTIDLEMLTGTGCTRRSACTLSLYDIGMDAAARLSARPRRVATLTYTGSSSVSVRSGQLPGGHLYLVYVVSRRTAIASSMGYVCPEGGDPNPETGCPPPG